MTTSSLTISIVSHGQGSLVRRLLADLSRFDGFEVIVTLNIAEDEQFLEGYAVHPLRVIRNRTPRGFGANHNAAFAYCRTPWFAVLNPDVRLPDNPFPALLAMIDGMSKPGVVAPRIVDAGGREEDAVRTNPTPWSVAARIFNRNMGRARKVPDAGRMPFQWLAGMFLLFSSEAFRGLDGFDERFFLYYEDFDICARLRRSGFAVAVGEQAWAIHEAQRDSRRSLRHLKWHVGSLLRVWTSGVFWWVLFGCKANRKYR